MQEVLIYGSYDKIEYLDPWGYMSLPVLQTLRTNITADFFFFFSSPRRFRETQSIMQTLSEITQHHASSLRVYAETLNPKTYLFARASVSYRRQLGPRKVAVPTPDLPLHSLRLAGHLQEIRDLNKKTYPKGSTVPLSDPVRVLQGFL